MFLIWIIFLTNEFWKLIYFKIFFTQIYFPPFHQIWKYGETEIDFILGKFDRKSRETFDYSFPFLIPLIESDPPPGRVLSIHLCHTGDEMRCNNTSHSSLKILRSSGMINCSHLTPLLWASPTSSEEQGPIRSRPRLTLTNQRPALGHVTWGGDPGPGTDPSCHGDGEHKTRTSWSHSNCQQLNRRC